MNRKYGKLNGTEIAYAPSALVLEGGGVCFNPDAEMYHAAGWKTLVDVRPAPMDAEHYVEPTGWTESATELTRTYAQRQIVHTVDDYNHAMEDYLREERTARGYDTREPSLYVNSSVPRWQQDAQDWIAHVDAVMTFAIAQMNAWSGKPATEWPTIAAFVASLPKVQWTLEA